MKLSPQHSQLITREDPWCNGSTLALQAGGAGSIPAGSVRRDGKLSAFNRGAAVREIGPHQVGLADENLKLT